MIHLLTDQPLVLLGVVLAIGGSVGAIKVRGVSLGPAGALLVGLAVSGIDDRLTIDPLVGNVGLSLFTFAVGLASVRIGNAYRNDRENCDGSSACSCSLIP
jgi:putative transport protein